MKCMDDVWTCELNQSIDESLTMVFVDVVRRYQQCFTSSRTRADARECGASEALILGKSHTLRSAITTSKYALPSRSTSCIRYHTHALNCILARRSDTVSHASLSFGLHDWMLTLSSHPLRPHAGASETDALAVFCFDRTSPLVTHSAGRRPPLVIDTILFSHHRRTIPVSM